MAGGVHSVKQGKVDSLNGRRGMVVSLDVEEYERVAELFGFLRVPGDGTPLAFSPLSPHWIPSRGVMGEGSRSRTGPRFLSRLPDTLQRF